MTITTNQFIDYFLKNFSTILKECDQTKKEIELKKLLLKCVLYSKELYLSYAANQIPDTIGAKQMPFLAIVSEIQLVAPSVVEAVATEDEIVNKALFLLRNYSDSKRILLRKYFLNLDSEKVIFLNDHRK